jgi:hypothetical protein
MQICESVMVLYDIDDREIITRMDRQVQSIRGLRWGVKR